MELVLTSRQKKWLAVLEPQEREKDTNLVQGGKFFQGRIVDEGRVVKHQLVSEAWWQRVHPSQ